MQSTLSRRAFLRQAAVSAAGAPLVCRAVEPFSRKGAPRLRLSLAAYSFRQYFKDERDDSAAEAPAAKQIDLFQFLEFCAAHHCDGAELTSYYFPKNTDAAFLLKLRREAFLRGLSISGTAVGNTFTHADGAERQAEIGLVKKWIHHAAVMGAPHIRIFAGSAPRGVSQNEAKKFCISAVEDCAKLAADKGVFLGLENHGGIVAEPNDLLALVRAINSPWVGINLDSGNFHTEDPYRDFEMCAPYAVNVQLKSEIRRRRGRNEAADLKRFVGILRQANYQGFVALEYEAEPDPWTQVPVLLKELRSLLTP